MRRRFRRPSRWLLRPTDSPQDAPGFYAGEAGLSPAARAGREIWYKATAGNARFHTYVFQQRIGVLIDWFRVLRADRRDDRFAAWGSSTTRAAAFPAAPDCPAKSLDETFGFEWCPGDDDLLAHVGKPGYRDPACDFRDAPLVSPPIRIKDTATSDSPRATSRSARRPARWAFASFRTRVSTGSAGWR